MTNKKNHNNHKPSSSTTGLGGDRYYQAPTTRARRKSANDSVQPNEPIIIIVPTPNSVRKAEERPSRNIPMPPPSRQRIKRQVPNCHHHRPTLLPSREAKEEEEVDMDTTVLPLVVSRDDDEDNTKDGLHHTTTTTTPPLCDFQTTNTPTADDTVLVLRVPLTMEDLDSTMQQLFVITTTTPKQPQRHRNNHPSNNNDTNNNSNSIHPIDWNDLIFHRPCVSARVLACFVLWWQQQQNSQDCKVEPAADLQPILPLLQAFVRVEAISLESDDGRNKLAKKLKKTPMKASTEMKKTPIKTASTASLDVFEAKQHRKVHFLSLDGSSFRPPIDRDLQSGLRQQQCIEEMTKAKEVIDSLTTDAAPLIQDLHTFLRLLQSPTNQSVHDLLQLCASNISNDYPLKWVRVTINLIWDDLIVLQERLTSDQRTPLQLEIRLAENIGQAIRYQLRVLFNPAPPRLCSLDTNYENRALTYSKVHQLMTMNKRTPFGLAVDDGFLSALISRALRRLYEYIDLEHLLAASENADSSFLSFIPTHFCASEPCHRHISPRIRSTVISDELTEFDRDMVIADVQKAAGFLSATYAARFLCDVFTTPGVHDEVIRMGGWTSIERYASTSKKYQLYESCTADAHLVPLFDFSAFLKRLQMFCDYMEPKTKSCIDALQMVANNYHIPKPTSPKQPKRKLHHYLEDIANIYNDMMTEVNAIPEIAPIPIIS